MRSLFYVIFLTSILWGLPFSAKAGDAPDAVFQAMESEASRSLEHLKIDVFGPPYFLIYQIRQIEHAEVTGSFGALIDSKKAGDRTLFVDVRIGDSNFDSSTPGSHAYSIEQLVPLDDDMDSLKRALWYETDLRYKQAIMNYLKKKGRFISGVESHDLPDFSKGKTPVRQILDIPPMKLDIPGWENWVRTVSATFKEAPEIEKSEVKIQADRQVRHYYDTDGNRIRDWILQYAVVIEAWSKTAAGAPLHDQESLFFSNLDNLPSRELVEEKIRTMIEGIRDLRSAPLIEPFVGPAIFSPDAAAVLFHEAIGHRVEGDRLRMDSDGKTFMKKVGESILPAFLTLRDNPQMKQFEGQDLSGHFQYDDEGQKSEEVVLIEHGVLKNFLLSRAPVLGFSKTNGHARSDGRRAPMSRMGNFIVSSENRRAPGKLKQMLIQEIKRQNKPYGLLIKKIMSGETVTESTDFQVFKGTPLYLYRVYPEDGREELVRGVEFVGTPLSMISKVIATGDDDTVINGFCGAESGFLPVTSITPTILLSEVELQASRGPNLRAPILPPPEL